MSEERNSVEEMKAAVLKVWPTASCNEVEMQDTYGGLTGEIRYIITTQHPRDLSGLMGSPDAAWAGAYTKLPKFQSTPESETAGGESSKVETPPPNLHCEFCLHPKHALDCFYCGCQRQRKDAQPICGVIGRKGLPCGLKAYDHAGKHCAFGPDGEPVDFWARGTVVPEGQIEIDAQALIRGADHLFGEVGTEAEQAAATARIRVGKVDEVELPPPSVITQAEKLEVEAMITETVGYGQPVSGPATIQLMLLLVQIPRLKALNAAYLDTIKSLETTRDELRKGMDEAVARAGELEKEIDESMEFRQQNQSQWDAHVDDLEKKLAEQAEAFGVLRLKYVLTDSFLPDDFEPELEPLDRLTQYFTRNEEAAELLNEKGVAE